MSNKLTFEEVEKIVIDKTNDKCKLISFIETHVNMEIECKCENVFLVLLGNFKKGKIYCNGCLEDIRKQKQFVKMVKFIHACGNYVLSKSHEYENDKSYLKILCRCGNVFKTTYKKYKHANKRQCNECGYAVLHEMQKRDMKEVYDLFEKKELIPMFKDDDYKNTNSNLAFKCPKHIGEDIQYTTYNSLVRDFAIGCKHCRNEKLREDFKIKNPRDYFIEKGFIPLFENEEYMNSEQPLPFICKEHEEFGVQYTDIVNVRYKKGCKYCSDSKSKGEIKIQEYLDKIDNIEYKIQEIFPECRNIVPLKFDFFIFNNEELKLVIEYDGIQHFEPVDFAGKGEEWAKEKFTEIQKRDKIKNDYCIENNINLLRVPYWEFNNIEEILNKELTNLVI